MDSRVWFVLLIPAAFAVFLAYMLIRQRKIDRLHREVMASFAAQAEIEMGRTKTIIALVKAKAAGEFVDGPVVEVGDGYYVTERDGKQVRTYLEQRTQH